MTIAQRINDITKELPASTRLIAVSKFHPEAAIREAYEAGQRIFGESKVQELLAKEEALPQDIEWHFIGHLQTNKVRFIVPFVHLIHSVDSIKLAEEINRQAQKAGRTVDVLLQVHIAQEETKFGFSPDECLAFLSGKAWQQYTHVRIRGLMGMATFTENEAQIRTEYQTLSALFNKIQQEHFPGGDFNELSMGMSDDYPIAIAEGSTLVRVGSRIFGNRIYS